MKVFALLFLGLLLAGCAKTKVADDKTDQVASTNTVSLPVLTPSTEKLGKVVMVNESVRFVVLSFPIGEVAERGQMLEVFRNDQKVGELRVTGPQRENTTAADILGGTPQVDDEVRGN